ncbi:MAG: SGNH/GDSL hydrolase family protein [Phycisphaeraceae bacterium]|nr:SGNH/GDSL hydrolase family protein [Phycisphaeraceae bacterium]
MAFLWQSDLSTDEPVMFIQKPGQLPVARLLFPATQILSATDTSGTRRYELGRDFSLAADGCTLQLTADSRVPVTRQDELYPLPGAPNSIAACRDSERHLLFCELELFPSRQIRITYRHSGWDGPIPSGPTSYLPRTRELLQAGHALRLVIFGDSISTGCNATACVGIAPHQPGYPQLLAGYLKQAYPAARIELANESVGGMCARWGVQNIAKAARHLPDLAILAWGMNDVSGRRPPGEFAGYLSQQMAAIRQAQPDCEFILISSMVGNPQWTLAFAELYPAYRDALRALQGPGVAVADMTTLWQFLLTRKSYVDLTGNGVNHPNDFGHVLYGQVLAATLRG